MIPSKFNMLMKNTSRILLFLLLCAGWNVSIAQQVKKTAGKSPVQLGDQYFAAGEYYTAANLYGQFLNPPKKQIQPTDFPLNIKGKRNPAGAHGTTRNDVLYKQAES